jgi:hypothetical protein
VNRTPTKLLAASTIALSCWCVEPARAQIVPPQDIVLYIQADIKDTDFVEPLVCALRQVLTAGVDVKDISLPLAPALLATPANLTSAKFQTNSQGPRFPMAGHRRTSIFLFLMI